MKELIKVYQDRGSQFIEDLLKDYVVITEKLSGSSFSFQKNGQHLSFYKGDNRKPLNLIDRTLMIYYEPPIKYISSISPDILKEVPDNWRFGFQYFVHNNPGVITYDKMPKNSLVLTHILVKDHRDKTAKVIEDPRVIKDWANKLGVTPMQPIFMGHLTETQKEKLLTFLDIPVEDQMELFGTNSFVEYLITYLNPSVKSTLLNTDLTKPIDSIVFKFYKPGSTQTYSAKVVDPYTRSLMKEKEPIDMRRAPADINEIVLLDILAFLEERGLKKHEVLSQYPEEKYLELISGLFNDYVDKRGKDLAKLDFQKADFAKAPEFDINYDLLRNEKTKELISGSDALKDLFKVMLGSLRKKRDPQKEGPLFTPSVIGDFNKMVDRIKKITEEEGDGQFKTFEDYLKLKNINEEIYIKEDLMDLICEETYLNFKDFVNLEKFAIHEALRVPHKNQGKKKVNMFAGRFQPFTLGHLKVLEDLHKQNGHPVMVMIVRGKKTDPKRTPFDEDTQQRMVAALQKQYPFIEGSVVVPNGAIDTMFSSLRPTYEPVLWGYGTDRKKSYDGQIQHDGYRTQLGVLPEFQGHEIKRGDEDVSASKVRNAIERDDRKGYEKLVPRSLHDFYDELQNIMIPIEESLLEAKELSLDKRWDKIKGIYTKFMNKEDKSMISTVDPKKSIELLRANFGPNDGTAGTRITNFLQKILKVPLNKFDLEVIPNKSGYDEHFGGQVSADFTTYKYALKRGKVTVPFIGTTWDVDGSDPRSYIFFVTNRFKIDKDTGEESVVGKKELTPEQAGLASTFNWEGNNHCMSPQLLFSGVETWVNSSRYPQPYKDFLIGSARGIMQSKPPSSFADLEKYAKSGQDIVYVLNDIGWDDIDATSLANIANDYGEILGGFMLFNILKRWGSGLAYPGKSNEALVDFYFDGYGVSSKAKSGGTPSGEAIMGKINQLNKDGDLTNEPSDIQEFLNNVIDPWYSPEKFLTPLNRSGIWNSVIALSNVNIASEGGYKYLLDQSQLNSGTITRESLVEWGDELAAQGKEAFVSFLKEYGKLAGFAFKTSAEDYYDNYMVQLRNPDRIGIFFYPLMVQISNYLEVNYSSSLTALGQKVADQKQVHLYVKADKTKDKGAFRFNTVAFKQAYYHFKAKGSVSNPWNGMIGIKITS